MTSAIASQSFGVAGNVAAFMRSATGGVMAGMMANTATIITQPSVQMNCQLLGADGGQKNLSIFRGDAAAGTPIDLGAHFPVPSATAAYEYAFYAPQSSAFVRYMVRRLDTRFVAEGSLTTSLPLITVGLAHRVSTMLDLTVGPGGNRCPIPLASQIMSKRIGGEERVLRFRGCAAN